MGARADRSTLIAAYLATHYDVEIHGVTATMRIGHTPPDAVRAALQVHGATCAAYLTAFNPRSRARSTRDNAHRQRALLALLAAEHAEVLHGDGHRPGSRWRPRRSVLAIGLARDRALALAEHFGQNAYIEVVTGNPVRLVFTRHWRHG